MDEDKSGEVAFSVANRGTAAVEFAVEVRSNLGETLLEGEGSLAAGESREFSFELVGQYREKALTREVDPAGTLQAVSVRLRHTDLSGEWQEPAGGQVTIPITVKPKPTKLDTSALAGLDNL